MSKFAIEAATPADVTELLALIRALARFEHLEHLMRCTEADLAEALFGERPAVEVVVARAVDGTGISPAAGYALFFSNYSTFLGRPGLYLEDVFVQPEYRRLGCGTALLVHVARIAHARGCGRFEWSVLDWNEPAQSFYRKLGASILPDWRIVRVTGDALAALARRSCPALDATASDHQGL
jgi:GNAT superfamily N-acetyltransferase